MCARRCAACISWAQICSEVMIWPSGFRQNIIVDNIFNLRAGGGFYLFIYFLVGAGPAALGEAGTGS